MTLGNMKTNRRNFIKSMSALGIASATYPLLSACNSRNASEHLNEKITKIEIFRYDINIPRYFSWGTWHNRQHLFIKISAGDFYYSFGNNRAFAYKVNTTQYGSRTAAEGASVLSANQLVYAREPLPRYVTTFYQDIGLTTPYDFGTSTGPVYLAYRASNIAPSGSSYVGNATQGSTSTNLRMAQALEFAAGDSSASQSITQDRRVWTGYFNLNGSSGAAKIAGQSRPKKS